MTETLLASTDRPPQDPSPAREHAQRPREEAELCNIQRARADPGAGEEEQSALRERDRSCPRGDTGGAGLRRVASRERRVVQAQKERGGDPGESECGALSGRSRQPLRRGEELRLGIGEGREDRVDHSLDSPINHAYKRVAK